MDPPKRVQIKPTPSAMTVDDLVLQLIQWSPQLHEKYGLTVNAEKLLIEKRLPYQSLLAESLLLPGFTKLPLHTD